MLRHLIFLMMLLVISSITRAQNDTIISRDGDILVGEIKIMEKGVLILKTDYSDENFKIEWDGIGQVHTHRILLIMLSDGRRLNGSITSKPGDPPVVLISGPNGNLIIDDLLEITYLKPIEKNFLGRLDASVELGYSFTKTKNHHQLNARSSVGYMAVIWGADGSFDLLRSIQDSVAPTKRTDASIGMRMFFNRSWFLALSNNFLQNDEQKLRLRSTTNLSAGHLFINNYVAYFGIGAGFAYNFESFTTDEPDEESVEGLIGFELNIFAHEDLSLLTTLKVYPSITVKGRIRSDFRFDIKYDLPLDFFIKLGFTDNFDNLPVAGASKHDYVISTTFGWEL